MKNFSKKLAFATIVGFAVSLIPVYATAGTASIADLEKAVAVCQQKVRQLEIRCVVPTQPSEHRIAQPSGDKGYDGFERATGFGGPYWGFQRDN